MVANYARSKASSLAEANRAIEALQATITEYRLEHNRSMNDVIALESKVDEQQATITELLKEVNCLKGNCKSHQVCDERARLQATITELEEDREERIEKWMQLLSDSMEHTTDLQATITALTEVLENLDNPRIDSQIQAKNILAALKEKT